MKTLIYGNRKSDDQVYDISTPEKELAAYMLIFIELDEDWQVYSDLEDVEELEVCEPCQKELHDHCVRYRQEQCACVASKNCKSSNSHYLRQQQQNATWKKWYDEAKAGNAESAMKLVKSRSKAQYEYESVREGSIIDPLEEKRRRDVKKAFQGV